MAIDSAAKRASAIGTFTTPSLRLVVPDGSTDRASALGMFNGFTEAGADVTAPTVSSVTIGTNGTTLTINVSESCSIGAGGSSGVTVVASGGNASAEYASGSGSTAIVYTISRAIKSTETATLTYSQPGNGIEDAAGNDLVSFSGQAVTNNSTQNAAPTDISLSGSTVYTTGGLNATVGTLSATDVDYGEAFTFSLVAGAGSTDNASFNISGATLRCNDPDALGTSTRSIRIRATDSALNTYEEAFTINVTDEPTLSSSGRLHISIGISI